MPYSFLTLEYSDRYVMNIVTILAFRFNHFFVIMHVESSSRKYTGKVHCLRPIVIN